MKRLAWIALLATLVIGLAGCSGDDGKDGADGTDGGTGPAGPPGTSGPTGPAGPSGSDGLPAGTLPTQPAGVVGFVKSAGGTAATPGGTVYFVPAADVAALPATTIAVDSTNDEPLEDVIAAKGASYQKATIGTDGSYSLATLAGGSYFVTYVPATADATLLPGGSGSRTAVASASLIGTQLDLEVSSATPTDAHFVGSGACVSCHGTSHISETMHRLGIWSSYETGKLQNLQPRFDDLYQAIEQKFEANAGAGTTIYFYDYDATRGFDKYKTSETNPGANVAFTVTVRRNGPNDTDPLEFVLKNVQNAADPDRVYKVDYVYGGGVKKQRYVTTLSNAAGPYGAMLPVQFQHDGKDTYVDRTTKIWRDYNAYKWYDETADTFKTPGPDDSFEKGCVSCHAAGSKVTKVTAASDPAVYTYKVTLVEDKFFGSGDFDFDGNGVRDEVNVGCESCHGPGSRHWEAAGQGKYIVSPSLLTPEREAVICGQCHSRPKGFLNTDSPINASGLMMIAGTSRNDYLKNYAVKQLDGGANDFYGDVDKHSKSHHQQYSDFIRSSMYKNGTELMTCSTCHDPHARTAFTRQLRYDPDNNVESCGAGSCHAAQATNLAGHLTEKGIPAASTKADIALCGDCHLTKTAKTGAGKPGLLINSVQYWENDITSHLFKVPDRALATTQKMPVPYTNECGECHAILNIAP
jgi:hypothetical protein